MVEALCPNKLTPKSTHYIFLGYCPATKGFRCLDPISSKVYTSRHVKFIEHHFPYSTLVSQHSSPSTNTLPTSFQIPLTNFSDISISVPISSSHLSSSNPNPSLCSPIAPITSHPESSTHSSSLSPAISSGHSHSSFSTPVSASFVPASRVSILSSSTAPLLPTPPPRMITKWHY